MDKTMKKAVKIVHGHLNKIYRESVKIASMWGTTHINLVALEEILRQSKVSESTEFKELNEHNKQFNKLLDKLLDTMKEHAKYGNGKSVHLQVLKKGIDAIKKGYTKGVNQS